MSHALLTVDRGDRPKMLAHCLWQVSNFVGVNPDHIIIDRAPKNNAPDLTERVKEAYDIAVSKGVTWLIFVESDDWYKPEYTHAMMEYADKSDFIGSEFTFYFNLKNRTWQRMYHPNHSSLFHTAFRVSAMKDFKWHLANKLFLDRDLWFYAKKFRRTFIEPFAIGIKAHGEGMSGGKGHQMVMPNKDPDFKWLASKVDSHSLEFYKSLAL